MIWIIGFLLFLLEIWVLKHTVYFQYRQNSHYKEYKTEEIPITIKMWHVILLWILNLSFMCLVTFGLFITIYFYKASDGGERSSSSTYWRLKIKNNKFLDFLNKKV